MAKSVSTPQSTSQIKPTDLVRFHDALQKWYQAHGRHSLPWRNTDDPYHIWLSEVMLQQTQVATVLQRFYDPFLQKFPTVEALAAAPREAVMKAWEGLGYYRRAGNLHEAAKRLVIEGGLTPPSRFALTPAASGSPAATHGLVKRLMALPGIGQNTAHAIAAFAYHQPVAILEANVKRVVARIFALKVPSNKELWAGAEALLNRAQPFDYNQAMMDLGSLICTPKNPKCGACPANSICKGKAAPEKYPAPKVKKTVPTREVVIHVRQDASGKLFLEPRDAKLLGGLYGFPQSPHAPSSGRRQGYTPTKAKREETLIPAFAEITALGTVTHIYSHFKLIGHVVMEKTVSKTNSPDWYYRTEIAALPLSTLEHKILALVDKCNTGEKKRVKKVAMRMTH